MTKLSMQDGRETKRVKLVHHIATNTNTMQRRLRKMSEEFQPTSFSFQVQARLLCVGMAVVYRVSISLTTSNTCTSSGSSSPGRSTQSWVIAMSQTKFHKFFAQVNEVLHEANEPQQLAPAVVQQDQEIEMEWKPFEVFVRMLIEVFRRYEHLQTMAFATHADVDTMNTGTAQLEGFLSDCWRAFEVIVPALVVEPYIPGPLGREVLCIYLLMRDFLSLPESVLDANCTYANAILSLKDVEDLLPTHSEHSCSICLEPLVSDVMKGLELPNNNNDGDEEVSPPETDTANFSVKLPCGHVFHENCIMLWLRHNASCPECRAAVGTT